jgi:hypothetical protein
LYDRIEPIGPDRRVQPVELTILTPVEREEEKQRRERERRRRGKASKGPRKSPPPASGGIDIRV